MKPSTELPKGVIKAWNTLTYIYVISITVAANANADKASRIFGGFDAKEHQFPFVVAINNSEGAFFGGSLISRNVVLTVASECIYKEPFVVYMGTNYAKDPENYKGIIVRTSSYVTHKQFDSVDHEHDIALIYLPGHYYIDGIIETIRLPSRQQAYESFDGEISTIAGVGVTRRGDKTNLQFLKVKVLSRSQCLRDWQLSEVFETQLCSKSRSPLNAPCHGDQGSPLTIDEYDGLPTQIGISSLFNCARDFPQLYTRVSSYLDWIENNGGPPIRDN